MERSLVSSLVLPLLLLSCLMFSAPSFGAKQDDDASDAPAASDGQNSKSVASALAGDILMQAMGLVGVAYRFGGSSPTSGFDCSGLIRYVFQRSIGMDLPRTAAEQARTGKAVNRDELQTGDIVFFNTRGFANSHSGIYLGKGKFIHAPSSGKSISISDMNEAYWTTHFNGARRVLRQQ
ncbi:C40 family peptidase [Crenobacter sp. SG2305]|uniref:C40 family peptidase n=1 Tax=Crenobacter oryzisoli TaxID=3056844 RepID=UPI0025AA841D|nr:C40 family peptidase [Crenobacter sp. SG2305]MDN0083608.1 C40 family peptidase [Crenobacter sp. SG2305]